MGTGTGDCWLSTQACVLLDTAGPGKLGGLGLIQSKYRGEREGDKAEVRLPPVGRGTRMGCLADCSSSFISLMELQNWDTTV